MVNMLVMLYSFIMGIVMKRSGRFPSGTANVLNQFIINITFPAVTLLYIHQLEFSSDLIFPALMGIIVFAFGAGFFLIVGKMLKLNDRTIGCLMLSGGLGNTSFVGFPMINAFYGEELIGIGVLCDQGSFFVLSTLGIMVAAKYASGRVSSWEIVQKVLMFPPFQAMALALILKPVVFPPWFIDFLRALGATITPLALASVGFQLHLGDIKTAYGRLSLGLFYKLIIAPLVIFLLYVFVFGARGQAIQVTVFEAAMAPMITASIIAAENDLDRPLTALMVGVGIPLSFITAAAWYYLLLWV